MVDRFFLAIALFLIAALSFSGIDARYAGLDSAERKQQSKREKRLQ
jgi:hypothetical protein